MFRLALCLNCSCVFVLLAWANERRMIRGLSKRFLKYNRDIRCVSDLGLGSCLQLTNCPGKRVDLGDLALHAMAQWLGVAAAF